MTNEFHKLDKHEKKVLGKMEINKDVVIELNEAWNPGGKLVAATDGGLKENVGTHAYKLVL